ncbi:MAG: hypothetical protein K8U57_18755 [Planctomycetes bacterium]|nr:hypothetical protein [Planctomycetota bacterium]
MSLYRLKAPAFALAAILLTNGSMRAQDKPDGPAILEKVKDGAGLTKLKEKLAADPVGSRFRVDGFSLTDDKALKVAGVALVPGGNAEDQADAEKTIRNKVIATIQDIADAKEFKDFEFTDKSARGDKLPHLLLQKAANEAGKTDRAADEVKLADSKFDAKGKLVITGVRGNDPKTLRLLDAAIPKVLAENPAAESNGKPTLELTPLKEGTEWPLSPVAIQKALATPETRSRIRVDRAFLVGTPAKMDETNPTGVAWAYALGGIVIGNDKPDTKAIEAAIAKGTAAAGWPAIKDGDLEGLTNADNRVPDPGPHFQKAIAEKPALDGVRIDSRTEFGPDGKLMLTGLQPGLDDKQLAELTQTVRGVLTALGTGGDANPGYKKLAENGVSIDKLEKVKVRELHADLRKWATENLDDVRLNRLYFDEQSKLVLTCEAPDDAVKAIVEKQLIDRATKVIPGLKAIEPMPVTEPKKDPEDKKDPEPKKDPPEEKKDPKEPKKDPEDKKDPPEKKDPKEPEKKDPEEKKDPKEPKKDPEDKKDPKEPEKKDPKEPEKKDPEEKKEKDGAVSFIAARAQEPPKTGDGGGDNPSSTPQVQFTKFKGGLTKFLQQMVVDPKNKQWDSLLIERGYFNENNEYVVRGVANSQEQRKAFGEYLDSLKGDPQWAPYFSPKPHGTPDLAVIPMGKLVERTQRVMPAYSVFDGIRIISARYVYVDDKVDPGQKLVFDAHIVGRPDVNAATELSKMIASDRKFYGRRLPRNRGGLERPIEIRAVPEDVAASDQVGNFTEGFAALAILKGEMAKAREWVDAGLLHAPHLSSVWFLSAYYHHLKGDAELVRRDLYRMIELEDPLGFDGPTQRKRRYRVAKDLQGEKRDQMEKIWLALWKEYKDGGKPMTFAETK